MNGVVQLILKITIKIKILLSAIGLIILLVINPLQAHAQYFAVENDFQALFNNKKIFLDWIHNRVDYDCYDKNLNKMMSEFIPDVLFVGLSKIFTINPDLVTHQIQKHFEQNVIFKCLEKTQLEAGFGAFFNMEDNTILIPKDVIAQLVYYHTHQAENSLLNYTYGDNTLIHEYLHFLEFDNLTVDNHNKLFKPESTTAHEIDVVYACAEQAYPSMILFNFTKACYTCAMAKNLNDSVIIDLDRSLPARQACSH